MSKIQRSTGGFTVDEIKNNIKMYANNYRVTKDKSLLIDIMKTVTPIIGDDISEEIVKSLKKEHKRVFGIKKAMEDDAIVKEFNNRKQQFPKQTNKKRKELEIALSIAIIFHDRMNRHWITAMWNLVSDS